MAGHQMPADFITEFRRTLDVNFIPDLNIAEIGNPQRLFHQIKADRAPLISVTVRQQPLLATDAPVSSPSSICRQLHHVGAKIGFIINGDHFRGSLNNTSKHVWLLLKIMTVSLPFSLSGTITGGLSGCQRASCLDSFFTGLMANPRYNRLEIPHFYPLAASYGGFFSLKITTI
jgi:hypothetical protein